MPTRLIKKKSYMRIHIHTQKLMSLSIHVTSSLTPPPSQTTHLVKVPMEYGEQQQTNDQYL